MKTIALPKHTAGFSLFEMLTVISILGIMAALALPLFSTAQKCKQAKDERNAQTLVSLAIAAEAAGVNLITEKASVEQIVSLLADGVKVTQGPLAGRIFKLPGLSKEDKEGVVEFLSLQQGILAYKTSSDGVGLSQAARAIHP